jgi:hypothetical protein
MQSKLFVIHLLLLSVGVLMIVGLIIFSQVLTLASAAMEMTDMELEDKAIKQELEPSETEPTKENNTVNQEEEQESNGDTRERGLEQNITIGDDIYPSDVIPFELPFNNIIPFP